MKTHTVLFAPLLAIGCGTGSEGSGNFAFVEQMFIQDNLGGAGIEATIVHEKAGLSVEDRSYTFNGDPLQGSDGGDQWIYSAPTGMLAPGQAIAVTGSYAPLGDVTVTTTYPASDTLGVFATTPDFQTWYEQIQAGLATPLTVSWTNDAIEYVSLSLTSGGGGVSMEQVVSKLGFFAESADPAGATSVVFDSDVEGWDGVASSIAGGGAFSDATLLARPEHHASGNWADGALLLRFQLPESVLTATPP